MLIRTDSSKFFDHVLAEAYSDGLLEALLVELAVLVHHALQLGVALGQHDTGERRLIHTPVLLADLVQSLQTNDQTSTIQGNAYMKSFGKTFEHWFNSFPLLNAERGNNDHILTISSKNAFFKFQIAHMCNRVFILHSTSICIVTNNTVDKYK